MKRSLVLSVALLAVLAIGSFAAAQTGPSGPVGPGVNPGMPLPANNQILAPDQLVNVLKKLGHQAEIRKVQNNNQTNFIVVANVQQDGWKFVIEFEYTVDQKTFNLLCPLGSASRFSATQLSDFLKKNYELAPPVHFSIRGSDQQLLLEDPMYNTTNMNEQNVQNILNGFIRKIRDTYPLWK